jgi:hypothetical protein
MGHSRVDLLVAKLAEIGHHLSLIEFAPDIQDLTDDELLQLGRRIKEQFRTTSTEETDATPSNG